MAAQFQHLFQPLQLGPITVPNRICFSGHATLYADREGLPTEREAYYYAERAKGGVGFIVIGAGFVGRSSSYLPGIHLVEDERGIPGFRRIADMVHPHGTKILCQVDHFGREMRSISSRVPVQAPSALLGYSYADAGETPKELESDEIEGLIDLGGKAARVVREGGLDGVEVVAAFGYLTNQFLSPASNRRQDEWGGSLENRMRYPTRLLKRIREELGGGLCLGIKLVGDEFTPGGLSLKDIQEVVKRLVATKLVDYITVDAGTFHPMATGIMIPDMSFPMGFASYLAAGVREVVNVPVGATKRIVDPVLAEKILADGQADYLVMARALVADPELPKKARDGRLEDIRQCTGVNQECIARVMVGHPMGCIQNPAAGEEQRFGVDTVVPAKRKKKVLVIGGGPGGLKTAEVAAQRGHEVHLYEKGKELGGQVLYIIRVASRREFESIIRYLRIRVQKLGVNVHLGEEMTPEKVLGEGADAVVVATGSTPLKTGYSSFLPNVEKMPGIDQGNVLSDIEALADGKNLGQRVLVIDEFGGMEATMTAEYIADQGKQVEIVTRLPTVGMKIDEFTIFPQMERLMERKVGCTTFTMVTAIEGKTARGEHVYSKAKWETQADSVVLVMGKTANEDLYFALKKKVPELHRVGDCVAPRAITQAIYEGDAVGRQL